MSDSFALEKFLDAQNPVSDEVHAELRRGRKEGHWMWFVFPQARGLGHSPMAQRYGIGSLDEARAYLAHPTLGPRLARSAEAALGCGAPSLNALFGSPDDLKFISSMSLFRLAEGEAAKGPFQAALDRWNAGRIDPRSVAPVSP